MLCNRKKKKAPVETETSVIYVKIELNFNDGYQTLTTVFDDILLLDEAFAFVLREQVEDKSAS